MSNREQRRAAKRQQSDERAERERLDRLFCEWEQLRAIADPTPAQVARRKLLHGRLAKWGAHNGAYSADVTAIVPALRAELEAGRVIGDNEHASRDLRP